MGEVNAYAQERNHIKIAPSILSADFAYLAEQVRLVQEGGAQYLHIDVMDGHFVPNITLGPVVVGKLRPHSSLVFDVHLMITHPLSYIQAFADAGADMITVHYETEDDLEECIRLIKACGKRAGISIKPATPADVLSPLLDRLDLVLVMSVEPGFGGQAYMDGSDEKIAALRKAGGDNIDISVDGGINLHNVQRVVRAGANVIVAGNAIFNTPDIKQTTSAFCDLAGKAER